MFLPKYKMDNFQDNLLFEPEKLMFKIFITTESSYHSGDTICTIRIIYSTNDIVTIIVTAHRDLENYRKDEEDSFDANNSHDETESDYKDKTINAITSSINVFNERLDDNLHFGHLEDDTNC